MEAVAGKAYVVMGGLISLVKGLGRHFDDRTEVAKRWLGNDDDTSLHISDKMRPPPNTSSKQPGFTPCTHHPHVHTGSRATMPISGALKLKGVPINKDKYVQLNPSMPPSPLLPSFP